MSDRDRGPPAPEGQQGPPTRAATRHEGALRDTRGSLPLTSGTASVGNKKKEDAVAWYQGFHAGRRGEPMRSPHTPGTLQSWSWTGGWIEGKNRRADDLRRIDDNREH